MRTLFYALVLCILLTASVVFSANTITPEDAINHIGQQATVCGNVASAKYSTRSNRQPTFLNLNRPYPHHIFTALIWGADRSKFSNPPEVYYMNKKICVSGTIEEYKGKAEIIVRNPNQIKEMR
jgi:DNA/RNA endonuclease YhcR with UshA esterase domain